MEIFIDSANLEEIEEALKRGFIRGITTNPSIVAKEEKTDFNSLLIKIGELIKKYRPNTHLSIEVFSKVPEEIERQAKEFQKILNLPELSIKVHIGWDELEIIRKLAKDGFSVNCTCCMTVTQAIMAAAAGSKYVSLFWGRIRDGGQDENFKEERDKVIKEKTLREEDFDPALVVKKVKKFLTQNYSETKLIIGSIRSASDIMDAGFCGADIVTIPPKLFPGMINHFKTDEVINQFLTDFQAWLK
ncbi:hypothetical protein C4572_01060 [Candidatus Parcubacteria bacterium]|nr:MAG: hypothetical protein C4572_01060 [Candidatus Parcubacteria bacterium]